MPTYTINLDGKTIKLKGDREPTEAETREAVNNYFKSSEVEDSFNVPPEERLPAETKVEPIITEEKKPIEVIKPTVIEPIVAETPSIGDTPVKSSGSIVATQKLSSGEVGKLYNTEGGSSGQIWIDNFNNLEPEFNSKGKLTKKGQQQVANIKELEKNFDTTATKVFKIELESLAKDGYTTNSIKSYLPHIYGAESSYGITEQDLNNTSQVHGDLQVKYSSFQDAVKQGIFGKDFGKAVGLTKSELKSLSYEKFRNLMRQNKKAAHLAGIGLLLQKLRNRENTKP
tara:strand:+ start:6849 stop:7703 length:855 start_codon:yes stop_codon:yes gene_type:complete